MTSVSWAEARVSSWPILPAAVHKRNQSELERRWSILTPLLNHTLRYPTRITVADAVEVIRAAPVLIHGCPAGVNARRTLGASLKLAVNKGVDTAFALRDRAANKGACLNGAKGKMKVTELLQLASTVLSLATETSASSYTLSSGTSGAGDELGLGGGVGFNRRILACDFLSQVYFLASSGLHPLRRGDANPPPSLFDSPPEPHPFDDTKMRRQVMAAVTAALSYWSRERKHTKRGFFESKEQQEQRLVDTAVLRQALIDLGRRLSLIDLSHTTTNSADEDVNAIISSEAKATKKGHQNSAFGDCLAVILSESKYKSRDYAVAECAAAALRTLAVFSLSRFASSSRSFSVVRRNISAGNDDLRDLSTTHHNDCVTIARGADKFFFFLSKRNSAHIRHCPKQNCRKEALRGAAFQSSPYLYVS